MLGKGTVSTCNDVEFLDATSLEPSHGNVKVPQRASCGDVTWHGVKASLVTGGSLHGTGMPHPNI